MTYHIAPRLNDRDAWTAYLVRFTKTTDAGCWEWQRGKSHGYGRVSVSGKQMFVHRIAYIVFVGDLSDDLSVCHKCDNPSCCNPDHLFAGTQAENLLDASKKGRHKRIGLHGEHNRSHKVTADQVRAIRADSSGISEIARKYGLTYQAIRMIRRRETWKHI